MAISGETEIDTLVKEITLSQDDAQNIEAATRRQGKSKEWKIQRKGRITASDFHRVSSKVKNISRNPQTNNLVEHLVGVKEGYETTAMKHGKATEPKAKLAYKKIMKRSHRKFVADESGLVIPIDYPYLGASPDLRVKCTCHGEGLCEIKCPYGLHASPDSTNYSKHLVNRDVETILSEKSEYYFQIQGQLGVTGLHYCDVFMYTSDGYFLQRIAFDAHFWTELLSRLRFFWQTYVGPALLEGKFNLRDVVPKGQISSLDHAYMAAKSASSSANSAVVAEKAKAKSILRRPKQQIVLICTLCDGDITDEHIKCQMCEWVYHENCLDIRGTDWVCIGCE